jgi:ribosomal protein S6E (S10)
MSTHGTQSPPLASPAAAPVGSSSPGAPVDVAAVLALNAQMQAAGAELQKKVQALEAEKAALLAQRNGAAASSAVVSSVSHAHPKGPTPPEFHGTKTGGYEIDAWVRDMRVQFSFYGARVFPDDTAKVRHAAMFLKGRAAEWWDAEDKSTGVENSWDLFVERLRERYRPMQAAVVARERLRRLKQTGTVSAFADVFQKELTPIKDMSASDQIFNFVSGLSSVAVANKVREKEPKTLHEAMDVAVRAEVFLSAGRFGHSQSHFGGRVASNASASVPMDVNALQTQAEIEEQQVLESAERTAASDSDNAQPELSASLMAKVEAMVQHRVAAMMQAKGGVNFNGANDRVPGLKASEIEKLRAEGRCFRCKQKGHSKRDCPKGPKPSFQ